MFDSNIDEYYVYKYQFIDLLIFVRNPVEVAEKINSLFPFIGIDDIDEQVNLVRQRFLSEGWKGDGEIGLIWLPPFIGCGYEDTFGIIVWHVKQENNGISWLLSPVELDFEPIRKQNSWEDEMKQKGWIPVNIIDGEVKRFIEAVEIEKKKLIDELAFVTKSSGTDIEITVMTNLVTFSQGSLIALFNIFLDNCYWQFLQEVVIRGNPYNLKIRKSSVKLDPSNYHSSGASFGKETLKSLTLASIAFDMSSDYGFRSFDERIKIIMQDLRKFM